MIHPTAVAPCIFNEPVTCDCSDQGALQQLQQLREQATIKAQQLQEQLQQALASGSGCEGACSEPWRQQVQQVEQGLELLLQQVQQFDQTYQQVSVVGKGGVGGHNFEDMSLMQQAHSSPGNTQEPHSSMKDC
jgi:hypothetical protein